MEALRRTFGIAEPVRRGMEMKIVGAGEWKPACLGGSDAVGMDILRGRDFGEMDWEDVFTGDSQLSLLYVSISLPYCTSLVAFPSIEAIIFDLAFPMCFSFPTHRWYISPFHKRDP